MPDPDPASSAPRHAGPRSGIQDNRIVKTTGSRVKHGMTASEAHSARHAGPRSGIQDNGIVKTTGSRVKHGMTASEAQDDSF